jgi:hypothetical protein
MTTYASIENISLLRGVFGRLVITTYSTENKVTQNKYIIWQMLLTKT